MCAQFVRKLCANCAQILCWWWLRTFTDFINVSPTGIVHIQKKIHLFLPVGTFGTFETPPYDSVARKPCSRFLPFLSACSKPVLFRVCCVLPLLLAPCEFQPCLFFNGFVPLPQNMTDPTLFSHSTSIDFSPVTSHSSV